MAKWLPPTVLDAGLLAVRSNCTKLALIKAYTAGDSYATVNGNTVASVAMVPTDFVVAAGASSSRVLTTAAGKSATASANTGAGPNLHLAFVDELNSLVLWVTDETSDAVVTAGVQVNFPSVTLTAGQPT